MSSAPPQVWVFFYGTIMNPVVMKDFGVIANEVVPARLPGFDIIIRPRPNLVRSERTSVYGSIMRVTHGDLVAIYSGLEKNFGIKYLPEAVFAMTLDGALRPALCYIVPHMADAPPDPQFVKQLAQCVRTMGHPEWYAAHVEAQAAQLKVQGSQAVP
jgi:Gamma-glutamyl cyclotransferase, AIG2-like